MNRGDTIHWLRRRARACRDRGAAAAVSEDAYAHYDEQVRFERAAELLNADRGLVCELAEVVRGWRDCLASSERLPDGSIQDPNAARELIHLDRLLQRAAAYEGDQAASSSAPPSGSVTGVPGVA